MSQWTHMVGAIQCHWTEKEAIELIEKHKLLKEEDENNIIGNFTGIQKFFTKNITYNKNTKMISGPALYIENSIE